MTQAISGLSVGASADDCGVNEESSSIDTSGTSMTVGVNASRLDLNIGCRFDNLTIFPASTIITCYWNGYVVSNGSNGHGRANLYFEKSVDPAQFSTYANFQARTRTTSFIANNDFSTASPYTTPNMDTELQEVIDQSGWAYSNAVATLFDGVDPIQANRNTLFFTYDNGSNFPYLDITYFEAPRGAIWMSVLLGLGFAAGNLIIPPHMVQLAKYTKELVKKLGISFARPEIKSLRRYTGAMIYG